MKPFVVCVSTALEHHQFSKKLKDLGINYILRSDGTLAGFDFELEGHSIHLVRSEMGTGGTIGSQVTVSNAIQKLSPDAVFAVGIAFGKDPEKQSIGDVLVSKDVFCYELSKIEEEKIKYRGPTLEAAKRLRNLAHNTQNEMVLKNVPFKIHIGRILSGEKVLDNKKFKEKLFEREPDAIGGEMEASGVAAACSSSKIDWIIIKGIADWGEGKDDPQKDVHQITAFNNAFDFFRELISNTKKEETERPFCKNNVAVPSCGMEVKSEEVNLCEDKRDPEVLHLGKDSALNDQYKISSSSQPLKPATPVTHALPLPPSTFFRGRETKIKEIRTELAGGSPLVLLSAMGGMGKTEICRHLFYLAKDTGLPGVENVGWLNYNGDISSTFYNQFEAVDAAIFNDPDEYLAQAKRYIRDQGKKLLLFIDNANDLSGKDMALVSGLGCKVVLTSRMPKMDRLKTITIDRLEIDDCLALYKSHSKDNDADITTPSEIIRLADRHTLTIELLAKAQNASGMSAGDLLQLLKEKSFDLSGITEKIPYSHQGERSTDEENPYENKFMEHLSVVFDIVDIEGEPLRVLRLFSLLPPDPLNGTDAAEWFELNNLDDLNALEKKGWLSSVNQGGRKFSMHPVLASVIQYKNKPTCQECLHLIFSLAKAIFFAPTEVFTIKLPFLPFAKSVADFFRDEEASFAYSVLAGNLSKIYWSLGYYPTALTYAEKALAIREKVLGKEHPDTATTYNNIAYCLDHQCQ